MKTLSLLLLVLAFSASVCHADTQPAGKDPQVLITNGGFEDSPHPEEWLTLTKGSKRIPGWYVAKGTVDLINNAYIPAAEGELSLELDGTMPGGISQFIDTEPGKWYRVSFAVAGNPLGEPRTKLLQVRIGEKTIDYKIHVNASGSSKSVVWKRTHFDFEAKAKRYHLDFESMDEDATCGPMIDDVKVTVAPPPATNKP